METDTLPSAEDVDAAFLSDFYSDILLAAGLTGDKKRSSVSKHYLIRQMKSSLLPFLRSSALLFHYLTSVTPPKELADPASTDQPDEFTVLTTYLGLSDKFNILLGCPLLIQLAKNWARHPRIHALLASSNDNQSAKSAVDPPLKVISQPHDVNQLVPLPTDYSELINSVSQFTCPNSDSEDSRSPTLCLVCGAMLCSQSYCCQTDIEGQMVGACTYHTHFCGAGVGIFLRIRDCKILLLAGKSKGTFHLEIYILY